MIQGAKRNILLIAIQQGQSDAQGELFQGFYSVKLSNRCIIMLIDMAFIYQPIYGLVRFIIIII